jgi:ankyrin repeat protein
VTDTMAPYGLSTTALAIIYNQMEIYQLLDSAGANRVSTMLHKSTGFEVGGFWSNYSTIDCSVSAEAILDDHRYHTCCGFVAKTLSNVATQSCAERDSFTRLHRSTLRLTTECLETLLMDPSVNINEVDSKGRTALHLATYLCDIQAVELLLRANASSEVRDYAGKSPLRVAAALDWAEGTALLAGVSVDLEQRNQRNFGNTILHNVCFQGHAHIVELLLDAGADMEAPNDIGETSLRHAVVRNKVEVLKVLHERGAAFTMVDNIGCTAFHDAILVNAHECLDFRVRVDQKYLTTGQTALHLLAEHADLPTLKIFMGTARTGLGELDIAARDGKGLTALKYLNLRRDDDSEFLNLFQLLLKRIEVIHNKSRRLPLIVSLEPRDYVDQLFEDDEDDDFTDAPENQTND